MKTFARLLTLFVLLLTVSGLSNAQDKPSWVNKGLASLENKRSNDSYNFRKFETFGPEIDRLRQERFNPLIGYLARTFGADSATAKVTLISGDRSIPSTLNEADGDRSIQAEYRITFSSPKPMTFYAKSVDEYVSFDENDDMSYDYTLYQLFAVSSSADGTEPVFDDYSYTRKYNASAVLRSIIPGLGQLYKGQTTKGWVIIGGEVALVGTAIYSQIRQHNYKDDAYKADESIAESYHSKSRSWRRVRDLAIAGAGALYIYNLIDAAVSKGARQVVVSKPQGTQLAFTPGLVSDPATAFAPAITMSLTF